MSCILCIHALYHIIWTTLQYSMFCFWKVDLQQSTMLNKVTLLMQKISTHLSLSNFVKRNLENQNMLLGFTQWPNLIDNRLKDVIWSLWTSLSIHINIDSCWFGFCSNGGMTSNLILKKRLSIVVAKKVFCTWHKWTKQCKMWTKHNQ
jgi:hypothetical protein